MKLLICEDEKEIREGLIDTINWEQFGISCVSGAVNGQEAMDKITPDFPDILLTDIRMPVMDGLALSQYVFENFPHIKIIILSGYGEFEYARKAISYNVVNYFLKPVPIKELTTLVWKICNNSEKAVPEKYVTSGIPLNYPPHSLSSKVKGYIDDNFSKSINIDAIADVMGINASYLSHIFKKETGMRCSEYLNRCRIAYSLVLLEKEKMTIEEIAESSGFSNSGYYITVFRKLRGITPANHRKTYSRLL